VPAARWRFLALAAAGAAAVALPAAGVAGAPALAKLHAQRDALAHAKRSAVLSLYSLDLRLRAADARLAVLGRREAAVRAQRALLERALAVARVDARVSQRQLAARVRTLYDEGATSALEVLFGSSSLSDALSGLDDLDRVTSIDRQLLLQVRTAEAGELRAAQRLVATQRRLHAAAAAAAAQARSLAAVRAARASYVAELSAEQDANAAAISRTEAAARAAEVRTAALTHTVPAAAVAAPVRAPAAVAAPPRGAVSVVATGYCLGGRTATGLPVGWGVAAVDPSVIPLGTRLTIPGYGTAVAADTGGAIVGDRIDVWFPTCALAGGWGTRSVTIALH